MAPKMIACPGCAEHVFASTDSCPHCGGLIRGDGGVLLKTAGAAMLGLALTACGGGNSDTGDTQETGETGTQADYGVADSGYVPGDSGDQPEYGVPSTTQLKGEAVPTAEKKTD